MRPIPYFTPEGELVNLALLPRFKCESVHEATKDSPELWLVTAWAGNEWINLSDDVPEKQAKEILKRIYWNLSLAADLNVKVENPTAADRVEVDRLHQQVKLQEETIAEMGDRLVGLRSVNADQAAEIRTLQDRLSEMKKPGR